MEIMQQLSEKAMSDEETDSDELNSLVTRAPLWHNEKLSTLRRALEQRKDTRSDAAPKTNAEKWAVRVTSSSQDFIFFSQCSLPST